MNDTLNDTRGLRLEMLEPLRRLASKATTANATRRHAMLTPSTAIALGASSSDAYQLCFSQLAGCIFIVDATMMTLGVDSLRLEADDQQSRPAVLATGLPGPGFWHRSTFAPTEPSCLEYRWSRSHYRAMKLAEVYGSATNADYL
jgi:hypothetical protein